MTYADAAGGAAAIDVDESTFQRDVLDQSRHVPVVVDFWAEWCAPCRILGPILERLAAEANGSWVLAKVDVDANPRLAAAARVQGIPAVRAFKDGHEVAEFTGALPEPQVRAWLTHLGPTEAEQLIEEGGRLEAEDLTRAAASYRKALELEPGNEAARRALAAVQLKLRVAASDGAHSERSAAQDPLDVRAAIAAADADAGRGHAEQAFDRLLVVVRAGDDDAREAARRHLVELFDAFEPDDPRVAAARRKLSLALF